MNLHKIIGHTDNKQLLADIAIKFLPMAEEQCAHMLAGIKGAKAGVRRAVDVQRDCKWILRNKHKFPASVVARAAKSKADANFEEHRYHAEKEGFLDGYREGRALEFMLRSVILMAPPKEEAENVPDNA